MPINSYASKTSALAGTTLSVTFNSITKYEWKFIGYEIKFPAAYTGTLSVKIGENINATHEQKTMLERNETEKNTPKTESCYLFKCGPTRTKSKCPKRIG